MFLLEQIDNPEPAPLYDYDETGVVLKGKTIPSTDTHYHPQAQSMLISYPFDF